MTASDGPLTAPSLIGAVVEVPEPDYLFGTGTLRLRIDRITDRPFERDGDRWLPVEGVAYSWRGGSLGTRPAALRLSSPALRAARNPAAVRSAA